MANFFSEMKKEGLYPGWQFAQEEYAPSVKVSKRLIIWKEIKTRNNLRGNLKIKWIRDIKLAFVRANDLNRCLYVSGVIDPNEFWFIRSYLTPGMVVIDIGANEGIYSLYAAKLVHETGLVLAVEPSARERKVLAVNITSNSINNIRVCEVAISDNIGTALLKIAEPEHAGQNTLGNFEYSEVQQISMEMVNVITLDHLVERENLQKIDLIKLDSEGYEPQILRGGIESILKFKPVLMLEVNKSLVLPIKNVVLFNTLKQLSEEGYIFYEFCKTTGKHIRCNLLNDQIDSSLNVVAIHVSKIDLVN